MPSFSGCRTLFKTCPAIAELRVNSTALRDQFGHFPGLEEGFMKIL